MVDQQERERRRSELQAIGQQEANRLEMVDLVPGEPETLESQRERRLDQLDSWEEETYSGEPPGVLEASRRRRQIGRMIEAEGSGSEPKSVAREQD